MVQIQGQVEPGFEPVRAAFEENFRERRERGAAVYATLEGRTVVDLWAGDAGGGRPWTRETATTIWSSTKGLVAVAYLLLVDRGLLDLDRPVSAYWPGFQGAGKDGITVRTLLNHRAGLAYIPASLRVEDLAEPERVAEVLERVRPLWAPGSAQGYHAISWGAFTGELFRRVAGQSVGAFLREQVTGPLRAGVHLGLPLDHPFREHVVDVIPNTKRELLRRALPEALFGDSTETRIFRKIPNAGSEVGRAFRSGPSFGRRQLQAVNDPAIQALELPWCGALASAEGLARIYTPLALGGSWEGVTLCRPETIEPVTKLQSWSERDLVLQKPIGWTQGFCKDEQHLVSPNVEAFGHSGMGGSVGFADPKERLAMGYVMNRMDWRVRSPRMIALCQAVYRCLGVPV
ncbi:MAG: serine hydrolase domain-containing protein [Planctomycetota bacterium]